MECWLIVHLVFFFATFSLHFLPTFFFTFRRKFLSLRLISTYNVTLQPHTKLASNMKSVVDAKQMSSLASQNVARIDDIIKSLEDKRTYRGLILKNGLKVLLVSDPTTDKSAACLCVEIGHMSDPVEIPGLAHFW